MARKSISTEVEKSVLIASRRRCCICFGLNRDIGIKPGQIAHLDKDSSNSKLENLVFLCFDHHDAFDSKSSQSKNLTKKEVKFLKGELLTQVQIALGKPVPFGKMAVGDIDPISGHYVRTSGSTESAEIVITLLPEGLESVSRYYISGVAFFGLTREFGPNMGELSKVVELADSNRITWNDGNHKLAIDISDDGLEVVEEAIEMPVHGLDVSFSGNYRKK
ncbi:MAG: hypothetical protein GXP03_08565 [Alphaproteobacteria bacterium]|nr:hypothetical protein [Alphaproteobacteria bacterium]